MKKLFWFSLLALFSQVTGAAPKLGAIATAHPLATEAGFATLAAGGNAVDAAVAISAVLGVVEPSSSGFGGGGFWLLHDQATDSQVMIDGREQAPAAATRDMYLNKKGEFERLSSLNGALAAGIPGLPAALVTLTRDYGKLTLADNLAAAEHIAREGFVVDNHYLKMAAIRQQVLAESPAASAIFLDQGKQPEAEFALHQPDLADTIQAMRERGRAGFYEGPVAKKLVAGTRAAGGIWSLDDLKNYRVVKREPIRGTYHGLNIIAAAPPSSGGVALVTILNIL